jgi:signal transduction histidine kinase
VITSFVVNFLVTRVRDANQRLEVTNKALRIENAERKRAEQAQRESEDKLRQIIETGRGSEGKKAEVQPGFMAQVQAILNVLPAYTWYAAPRGALTFVNKRTADYLGVPKDHPLRFGIDVGAQWDAHLPFVHPDDRAETQENWSTRLRTGEGGEGSFRVRNAQGAYRWFLSRAEPLRSSDGTLLYWVGVNVDIEELKCAEQALRESEGKFRDYAETTSDWFWEIGPDYKFTLLTENAFHSDPADRIGTFCWDHALDLETEPEKWRLVWATLDSRKPFRDFVYCSVAGSGSPMYVKVSGKPVFDANGEFRGYRGTGTDVTPLLMVEAEARENEQRYREVQLELAHANRVATMGQLTALITHEVNQPITAAVTYALAARRFLSAEPPNFREVDDALSLIVKEGNRAGEVVERVRALIKKVPARKDAVAIDDAILEVIALIRADAANKSVSVRTQFAEGLPRVQGDRVQLQQVMLNLIVNAIQAMSGIGEGPRELQVSIDAVPSEGRVRVGVRDTGQGLSPESLSRLFEPFYTTKPEGMGMGLSICRSIIEAHGGRLWAIPCEPQGALFQFTIPAT